MTTKIDDGGPVCPQPLHPAFDLHVGITLRDWFAGQALAGFCSNFGWDAVGCTNEETAVQAYELADAMIAARKGDAS
jgi:hypothetical protein